MAKVLTISVVLVVALFMGYSFPNSHGCETTSRPQGNDYGESEEQVEKPDPCKQYETQCSREHVGNGGSGAANPGSDQGANTGAPGSQQPLTPQCEEYKRQCATQNSTLTGGVTHPAMDSTGVPQTEPDEYAGSTDHAEATAHQPIYSSYVPGGIQPGSNGGKTTPQYG